MTIAAKQLTDAAKTLPPNQRLELVEQFIESLDASDEGLDRAWAQETEDRLAAYRRGEIEARHFDNISKALT